MRGQIIVAPLADMFNYSPDTYTRTGNEGDAWVKHHVLSFDPSSAGGGGLTVLSDRNCASGDRVV